LVAKWINTYDLQAPRKDCCRVLPSRKEKEGIMYLWVGHCGEDEVIEV